MCDKLNEKLQCFLCRKQICGVKPECQFIDSEALEKWTEKCWDTLSQILFKSKDHSLKYILCNGGYCTNCQKKIWDLDFTFKTLQKLETRLGILSREIVKDFRVNYETICNEKGEKKPNVFDKDNDDGLINVSSTDLWGNCSYDEAVRMVFKALNSTSISSKPFKTNYFGNISSNNKRKLKRPIRHSRLTVEANSVVTEALSNVTVKLEIPDEIEKEEDCNNDNEANEDDFAINNEQWIPSESEDSNFSNNLSLDDENDDEEFDKDFDLNEDNSDSDYNNSRKLNTNKRKVTTKSTRTLRSKQKKVPKTSRKSVKANHKKSSERSEESLQKNIKCSEEDCPRRFKDELGLQIHIRKDHLELLNPFHCTLCEKDFSGVSNLKSHLRRHEGTFRFPCPVCQKGYHTKINLELHMESRHSTKSPDQVCPICSKRFKTSEELETHTTAVHTGPNPFTCEDCKVLFTNSGDLKSHVQQNHQKPDGPFCSACGKSFATMSYLKAHQRLIHPKVGTLLKCRTCGEKFEKISLLTAHRETHVEGETKACQCDQCGRSFKGKKGLAYHMLTHTGEKPYKCKICGKGFRQSAHCKKHEEIHSGLQNYVCHICGKACTNKGNLRLHMKIHDKETGIPKIRKPSVPKKQKKVEEPTSTSSLGLASSTCSIITQEDLSMVTSGHSTGGARIFQQGQPSQPFRFNSPGSGVDYYGSGAPPGLSHYQYSQPPQFPAVGFGGFKM